MFSAKFLLTYAVVAAGAWDASIGPDHWQLLFQVACAVVMSLTIFFAILRATEADAADPLDSGAESRNPALRVILKTAQR